jgi:hypothetical protein
MLLASLEVESINRKVAVQSNPGKNVKSYLKNN